MVDWQLTSISTDIDPKGLPGPLGSSNVPLKSSSCQKLNFSKQTEKAVELAMRLSIKIVFR